MRPPSGSSRTGNPPGHADKSEQADSAGRRPPPGHWEFGVQRAIYTFALASLAALLAHLLGLFPPSLPSVSLHGARIDDGFSRNISNCPGYALSELHKTQRGLTARLDLAGAPCNAFGTDVQTLSIAVTYETRTRLHISIADADAQHYTLPAAYFPRPIPDFDSDFDSDSDLEFHHQPSPFALWVTRRSTGDVLFDTRPSSLPAAPTHALDGTPLDGFALVFEDKYLQLTSALPHDANIYGLGEAVATAGFRRDVATKGTMQTMWARDAADPEDENMYGMHAVHLEHRVDPTADTAASHAVFLSSAAGADVLLTTPPGASQSLIQYRLLGGTLDLYLFSGPNPNEAIEQYGALVGLPALVPYWSFGFHLCRWGYENLAETREQVEKMREVNVPLEVMWNDIDLYHSLRDFTADPVSYPPEEVRTFIRELRESGQHYIPILDAGVGHTANDTDDYLPFLTGIERGVFIANPDNSTYIGQVWPGYAVWPDWFARHTESWWAEALANWSALGVEFSGLWLDMNEPSSFCTGSCGSGADLRNTTPAVLFPGDPGDPVLDWPEGYDVARWGASGNISINGELTYGASTSGDQELVPAFMRRDEQGARERDPNDPPYAIHNGWGGLAERTVAPNATHANGDVELDTHNLFGYLMERATHLALQKIRPDERPFLISRSTFPSSGHWTGHWLGDNFSKWSYLRYNIQGVLHFQIFQIPMVGADTCGFNGNTDEELCNRWMSLSAFTPFYRNHNERGAISQEPYRWDSVAEASRAAMAVRYSMLPYWYTLFTNASTLGTPPVRALFWEFPAEAELLAIDLQFLIGRDVLVTPVTTPNVSSVTGVFPGRGDTIWRDWYTHEQVALTPDARPATAELSAPLGHIPVHVRGGAALLLHAAPGYTTTETRAGPFALLVVLGANGAADGSAYIDDGISPDTSANRSLHFTVRDGSLRIMSVGTFEAAQHLERVTILGVRNGPAGVRGSGGDTVAFSYEEGLQRLNITGLILSLNGDASVHWA